MKKCEGVPGSPEQFLAGVRFASIEGCPGRGRPSRSIALPLPAGWSARAVPPSERREVLPWSESTMREHALRLEVMKGQVDDASGGDIHGARVLVRASAARWEAAMTSQWR